MQSYFCLLGLHCLVKDGLHMPGTEHKRKKKSLLSRIHILVEETQADMTGGALIRTSEENKAE